MYRKIATTLLGSMLMLPLMAAEKPLTRVETTEARATVLAVDQTTRMVRLKGEDGSTFDVEAGPEVEHLDQVKPGDVVHATYTESVAFKVVPASEKSKGATVTAKKVKGGAEVGHEMTTTFKVASVDPATNVLWVTLENGDSKKIQVKDPAAQKRLKTLSPGNVVSVTYTESLAIHLEKVAH